MRTAVKVTVSFFILAFLAACAVGPGTPLFDAMQPDEKVKSGTVQPPSGYGPPTSTVEAQGLINTRQRKETAAYLKSLANDGDAAAPVDSSSPPNQ